MFHLRDPFIQRGKHRFGIADQMCGGFNVFIDFGAVYVNLQNLGALCKGFGIAGDAVGKPCADGNQKVTFFHGQRGGLGAVHTDHAGKRRILRRKCAKTHDRERNRCVQKGLKRFQFVGCACGDNAAAGINQRFFGRLQKLDGSVKIVLIRFHTAAVDLGRLCARVLRPVRRCVLGDIHQDRAGSAGSRNRKGLADGRSDVLCLLD